MRPIVHSLCKGLLCAAMPFTSFAQQTPSTSFLLQSKQESVSLPSNVSEAWYNRAMQHLQEREYFMKPMDGTHAYGAVNRAQHMAYYFSDAGYRVKPLHFAEGSTERWEATFELGGVGRSNQQLQRATATNIVHNGNELLYYYNGFAAQYINQERGMRQNFIVQQRPGGEGMLQVELHVSGDLQPFVASPGKIILHTMDQPQDVKLVYDELRAWDANNRPIAARFESTDDGNIVIVADDKDAVYPITIDPLNHGPNWTDSGNGLLFPLLNDLSTPVLYGTSVSGAGDVNGDNIDDIIIGAPAFVNIINISGGTFTAASVGAAFIYYGSGGGPSLTPNEALQPTTQVGALFGYSVSAAGDVNGDGFDDVVVGAPGDHTNLTVLISSVSVAVGRIYVYYGGPTFDGNVNTEPLVSVNISLNQSDFGVLALVPANPLYGFSVSNAGSVNGDVYSDIVVGSPAFARLLPPVLGGRVDIYHGSATGVTATPSHTITGNLLGGLFGFSVSTAGNVNGDGFSDVIVGAPASVGLLPPSVGSAFVFHGSGTGITATTASGANSTLQAPAGLITQTLFGYSVSNAGDVNGDGFGDVLVGEPLSAELLLAQLSASGKVHVFYGSGTGVVTTGATQLTSPRSTGILGLLQGNLLYGFSVDSVGDMNCDGLNDIIIGEPGGTAISLGSGLLGLVSANALSGKAYIYYGRTGTGPLNSPSFLVQESNALSVANLVGTSVSAAGDVNGDGNADFLIGAPNGTLNVSGGLTGIVGSVLDTILTNSIGSVYGFFGCLTAIDLDFDNDGVPDAIDLDDDNDGTPDLAEYPGLGLTQDPAGDADGDGIPNYQDPTFTGCGGLNGNGICTAFDKDGDGVPNSFDIDADNDGTPDVIEAGGVDTNGDGILDNFTDTDADGLAQTIDANNTGATGSGNGLNAPDFDGDALPNNIDLDSDGDGISDLREAGLPDADNNALIDGFADADADGFANSLDPKNGHSGASDPAGPGTPAVTTPTDTNNDGRYNGNPTTANTDSDTQYNALDADSDNDGITDNVEAQSTTGYSLPAAGDTDNDGLANIYEGPTGGGITPYNHDGTDNPDYLDADSDNDLMMDVVEGHDYNLNQIADDDVALTNADTDADGIDNKFDLVAGPNVTTAGMGSPAPAGSKGPLQASILGSDRDFRNNLLQLPITLTAFSGRQSNGVVLLSWTTASEQQSSYFEVQRSSDGIHFSAIGKVAAQGNSDRPVDYSFTDPQPQAAVNYYRLKMVDLDERFALSKIVLLRSDRAGQGIIASPNPVRDQLQVIWNHMPAGDYKIELFNSSGRLMKTFRAAVTSNNQVMVIAREASWLKGTYLLRLTTAKDKQVIKIVLE
ncbi:T9SS type A sorting domain-containing protein [Paraflavitalea sp. CAU 1676]|uniref:T9SS type A sorting domain-containing protein n=1 Tax=Paraflavitalea sp. CAU 1676 TaxID=3032598 RepID=UPI0023DBB371|nr:T9SS type A sorting domain-containing protein [Paraflavitalea sp. CAU 1676]MDF2186931.1 T9SS type A sorting domain-containing protein [Paraflavitalea sp. CAU 1676]